MTRKELLLFTKEVQLDYFEKRMTLDELVEKYKRKKATIQYHLMKAGITRAGYLKKRYTKEYLENALTTTTYKTLAKKLNCTLGEFRRLVHFHNIKRNTAQFYKKNIVKEEFYSSKKFEKEFYYFVGLFVTDGCFSGKNSMKISIKNKGAKELLTSLSSIIGNNNVKIYNSEFYTLTLTDRNLKEKLLSLGIPEKEKTYLLRDIYIPNSDCLYSFLAGALDGDGHIDYQLSYLGYRTSIGYALCNYNIEFLKNLKLKIKDILNFNCIIHFSLKGGLPVLVIGARNNSKKFFNNLYAISPIFLKCKYEIYQSVINKVMI
ncbi:MAG TPA: hypothetical protein PKD00_00315 [Burkholderiales bacterium]|nr:hypothetical protein [Burkholderiales bacterium]